MWDNVLIAPLELILPSTVNFSAGEVVPIPILRVLASALK